MMKTQKWMRAALLTVLAATVTGCADGLMNDIAGLSDPDSDTNPGKTIINVGTAQDPATRVSYDDTKVNGNQQALAWQEGDKLTVVGRDASKHYIGHQTDYTLQGTGGTTSGSFEGTAIANSASWHIYYPNTVTVQTSTSDGGYATLPMTGQKQTADNDASHLKDYLLLGAENVTDLSGNIPLKMINSIMKFHLINVPEGVGKLSSLIWSVEGGSTRKYLTLEFAPEAVTFGSGTSELTAYLAFTPTDMQVPKGGTFEITLIGDKAYKATTTITGGKTYKAGLRYTAEAGGTDMGWTEDKGQTMKFTVQVEAGSLGFKIPFPTSGTTPATLRIDWGDGSGAVTIPAGTTLSSGDSFEHTYTAAGSYPVSITAITQSGTGQQIPAFRFDKRTENDNAKKLISFDTALLNAGNAVSNLFKGCERLTSVPAELFDNNTKATSFLNCFYGCAALTSIPAGLFDKTTSATSFGFCFYGCAALTGIPEGLFDKAMSATNFSYCFNGCAELKSIPKVLFDKTMSATNFSGCFKGCTTLTSIPEGLFDQATSATNFSYCFQNCTTLTGIPTGLFDKAASATNFSYCFKGCTKLESIPAGLFDQATSATNFSYCFSGCQKLVLNDQIFSTEKNKNRFSGKAMNFGYCFSGVGTVLNSGAGGTAPDLWDYEKGGASWTTTDCFQNCTNVTNATSIPADWN